MINSECGVYKITNIITGKCYIGSSINIHRRWRRHINDLKKNSNPCLHLQNAWNKYGADNFEFSILEYCDRGKILEREQYYIDNTPEVYNICPVAGNTSGRIISEETREKLRLSHLGHIPSEETREKLSLFQSTRIRSPRSEETKAKLSAALSGRTHPGVPRSEETREKIRLAKLGQKYSEETKAKMSASQKANTHNSGRFKPGHPPTLRTKKEGNL